VQPLAGIRILDLSSNLAGPLATLTLARLGASVTKVERPVGDPSRAWGPFVDGMSVAFDSLNRCKRSLVLDLKSPPAMEVIRRLVSQHDVLVHNFGPGVAERLGLDEASVRRNNEDIIYCAVAAFGSGPSGVHLPGYDGVVQAFTGIMEMTGHPGAPPVRCAPAMIDMSAGQWAVIGIMGALMARQWNEPVRQVDVALVDSAMALIPYQAAEALLTGERPRRFGSGSPLAAPHQVFMTADRPIFVGAPNQRQWEMFVRALDAPGLLDDERFASNLDRMDHLEELEEEVNKRLAAAPASVWQARFEEAGIPVAEVLGLEEAVRHPMAEERSWFEEGDMPVVRLPLLIDGEVLPSRSQSPQLGEHTVEILEEAGLSSEAVEALLRDAVAVQAPDST
jgi:crotonobetainyl-CoA:carnitine CoA-transferase CaiB-like acyl-CoA transferase